MPQTTVVFFADDRGRAPVMDWLDGVPTKVQDKCMVKIDRLIECGHELRRPEADILRDGIYELRIGFMAMNYRILYFFHQGRCILAHGVRKDDKVPANDIDMAIRRRQEYVSDPERHTYIQ